MAAQLKKRRLPGGEESIVSAVTPKGMLSTEV
jgi:hypothetical protein